MNSLITKLTGGSSRTIPSLDGLRAISIVLVIIGHLSGTRNFPIANQEGHGIDLNLGNLGVRVFFVISGFLITSLMLSEWKKTGTISLQLFYLRRTFRIFPPFYAFLSVVLGLTVAGILILPWSEFAYAATYTMNFVANRSWNLGHLWSLAVEEQFYLLWPFVLVSLGIPAAMRCAVAVVLLSPLIRIGLAFAVPSQIAGIGNTFYTIADPLAIGCCLAGYSKQLADNVRYQAFLRSGWIYLLAASIFVVNALPGTKLSFLFYQSYVNLAIAICMYSFVRYPGSVAGRFLNLSAIRAVGVLSYSLYLWQQLFINRNGEYWWNAFPANLLLALVFAVMSFLVVETPTLEYRKRLEAQLKAQMSKAPDPVNAQ